MACCPFDEGVRSRKCRRPHAMIGSAASLLDWRIALVYVHIQLMLPVVVLDTQLSNNGKSISAK